MREDDFPILAQEVHDKKLVYLDTAATSQKPRCVMDAIRRYYSKDNSNIHRGVHALSERATKDYESTRGRVQKFINAKDTKELIFTRGTTEAINLVAETFGRANLESGDEILVSTLEHHSNIVPWQMICNEINAHLRVIPINDRGELLLDSYKRALNHRTKIVALGHVSNALGTINPVKKMIRWAHEKGIPVLVDGAQAIPHMKVDVQDLDCDFYAFSGHKMYGPTGTGVLYGKQEHLESMPPYQGGGEMIRTVTFEKTTFNDLPHKFEAGTPNIAGVIGLSAAIDFIEEVGISKIAKHEDELLQYALKSLGKISGLRFVGTAIKRASVISFIFDDIHPHDIGTILDKQGIAIRTGHHCAMPLMERLKVPATARVSFGLYNTKEEIDLLVAGLKKVKEVFKA